jgi:hypothetical protein
MSDYSEPMNGAMKPNVGTIAEPIGAALFGAARQAVLQFLFGMQTYASISGRPSAR